MVTLFIYIQVVRNFSASKILDERTTQKLTLVLSLRYFQKEIFWLALRDEKILSNIFIPVLQ